jgi:arginyl-tRNA synthetase
VLAQAQEKGFAVPSNEQAAAMDLSSLTDKSAEALMNRLSEFGKTLTVATKEFAPHTLCFYLKDLAADFHAFYNAQRILVDNEAERNARLALLLATRQVLRNGFALLGISAPTKM